MKVTYKENISPTCCKTWRTVEVENLTPAGVLILLNNLVESASNGALVKSVTITRG